MDVCKFCHGKIRHAEESFGGGVHTMRMMLEMLTGRLPSNDDEYDNCADYDDDVKDGIKIENGNLLTFDNSSGEYTSLGVRIHYCPMCGKKLEERGTEDDL